MASHSLTRDDFMGKKFALRSDGSQFEGNSSTSSRTMIKALATPVAMDTDLSGDDLVSEKDDVVDSEKRGGIMSMTLSKLPFARRKTSAP